MAVMRAFPAGFAPERSVQPHLAPTGGLTLGLLSQNILRNPAARTAIEGITANWPDGMVSVFVACSNIIAQIIAMYGGGSANIDLFSHAASDPELMPLLTHAAHLQGGAETPSSGGDAGSVGVRQQVDTLMRELHLRVRAKVTAFGPLISVMLGPSALVWLATPSASGAAKLQPHELSRTGWATLDSIRTQFLVEDQLRQAGESNEETAKVVVAMCWTMVALASFMDPALFLTELDSHVSSLREGQLTISQGLRTHSLRVYDTRAMLAMVSILREGLEEDLLSARDLMWIAVGLAKKRGDESGHAESATPRAPAQAVFLSHRGRDAKLALADRLLQLERWDGYFLDCLVLPKGVINRRFVFDSLANAERVVVVDTPNFLESAWCRKELWLAERLAARGMAKVEKVPLSTALAALDRVVGPEVEPAAARLAYPIADRVMKDIDYWARAPNKYSLAESGSDMRLVSTFEGAHAAAQSLEEPERRAAKVDAVLRLLGDVARAAPDGQPLDLWSTALQYAVAILGARSRVRSKVRVRYGIDQLVAALRALAGRGVLDAPELRAAPERYLAFLAAAVVLDLSEGAPHEEDAVAIRRAVAGAAVYRDGLVLVDTRAHGASLDAKLRLVLTLVANDIAGAGIIQSADAPVHEREIDGKSLAVLPCVTLYPGMERLFEGLA
jgi:hypothetical protein